MQEISNLRELKKRQYRLYVIIMLTLFVVMLAYTIIWCVVFKRDYGSFVKAEAEVVELKNDYNEVAGYGLEYYDSVNKVNIIINNTSLASAKTVGKIISIYYDVENPSVFTEKLSSGRYLLPIITGVYGAVSVVLSILFFTSFYGKNSTMQREQKYPNVAEYRKEKMLKINRVILKNKAKIIKRK